MNDCRLARRIGSTRLPHFSLSSRTFCPTSATKLFRRLVAKDHEKLLVSRGSVTVVTAGRKFGFGTARRGVWFEPESRFGWAAQDAPPLVTINCLVTNQRVRGVSR